MHETAASSAEEIIGLETAYWEAMKAKDGRRTSELSGAASLVTGPRGVMRIERDRMAQMTESGDWTLQSYALSDVQVVRPAPNVAIIAYTVRQVVTMGGKPAEMVAADSSTWVRDGDGWACHAHSETVLEGAQGMT